MSIAVSQDRSAVNGKWIHFWRFSQLNNFSLYCLHTLSPVPICGVWTYPLRCCLSTLDTSKIALDQYSRGNKQSVRAPFSLICTCSSWLMKLPRSKSLYSTFLGESAAYQIPRRADMVGKSVVHSYAATLVDLLSELKKLSMADFSQSSPTLLRLQVMPWSSNTSSSFWKCSLVFWAALVRMGAAAPQACSGATRPPVAPTPRFTSSGLARSAAKSLPRSASRCHRRQTTTEVSPYDIESPF